MAWNYCAAPGHAFTGGVYVQGDMCFGGRKLWINKIADCQGESLHHSTRIGGANVAAWHHVTLLLTHVVPEATSHVTKAGTSAYRSCN